MMELCNESEVHSLPQHVHDDLTIIVDTSQEMNWRRLYLSASTRLSCQISGSRYVLGAVSCDSFIELVRRIT